MRTVLLLLAALAAGACARWQGVQERERLKREILAELQGRERPAAGGRVTGRILWGRRPVAGCRVRLVRTEVHAGLFGAVYRDGPVLETKTGPDGRYLFEHVPPGRYKLFWAPPGARHWIRFLDPAPEVTVLSGETTTVREVDTGQHVLG